MNRKEFIQKTLRTSALMTLLGGSFWLLSRENHEECTLDFVCKNCKKQQACNLEQADDYRKSQNKK